MPWLIKADAAHQLGVSLRTLSDRLSEGKLEGKRDGHRVLVYVPDKQVSDAPLEIESSLGARSAGTAMEVLAPRDVSIIASAMEAVRETRTSLEHLARTVRVESEHARQAEQRADRRSQRVLGGFIVAACVLIAAVVAIGWHFQGRAKGLAGEVAVLRQALVAAESTMAAAESRLASAEAEYRDAGARIGRDLESLRVALAARETACTTDVAGLEADVTAVHAALTAVEDAQGEVGCELEWIAVYHEQLSDELAMLRDRVRSVEGLTTLQGLLDRTWNAPNSDPGRLSAPSAALAPSRRAFETVAP